MIGNYLALAALVYLAGAGMQWWRGPIARCHDIVSWLTNRRSDAGDMSSEGAPPDVMTDDEGEAEPSRTRYLNGPLVGPVPLSQLTGRGDDDEQLDDDDGDERDEWWVPGPREGRQQWVERMMLADQPAGWIDDSGSQLFSVHPRTLARDRAAVRDRQERAASR